MSDNESTQEPTLTTEPVAPTKAAPENDKPITLNKNGKPRKTLTAEALEKLKLAREKANAIRQASCAKKHNDKTAILTDVIDKFERGIISDMPPPDKPKKSKKKTKIIVEQSSDDSDEFEPNDNIVFVKRVSRKKKEIPVPEPVQCKEPEYVPPAARDIPAEQTMSVPMLTAQEIALKNQYNAMFSGGFLNKRSFY